MALSKTLTPLLSLIASIFFLMLANKVQSQGGEYISFQYDSFEPPVVDLIFQQDAFVPPGSSYVRLTRTGPSGNPTTFSVGRVVFGPHVRFWEPGREATFETTIRFNITAVDSEPADGIAFFIAPVDFPIGFTGGSFGIFDSAGNASSVFAVEFDIFYGSDNAQWDPSYRHIGININSRTSSNVTRFDIPFGQLVTARINYDSNTGRITVVANYGSQTTTLSYVLDLKTILTQWVQVGIAGATGGSVALHDLYSWYFTSTLVWHENSNINSVEDNSRNNDHAYIKSYV